MAKPTRRSVLRAGVVVAATSVPLGIAGQALSVVAGGMASGLRRSTFQPHLRSTFALDGEEGSYRAVLTQVGDLVTSPRGHDKKFRLLFRVQGARPAEGIYRISNGKVSPIALFVAPVGRTGEFYEAVVDAR